MAGNANWPAAQQPRRTGPTARNGALYRTLERAGAPPAHAGARAFFTDTTGALKLMVSKGDLRGRRLSMRSACAEFWTRWGAKGERRSLLSNRTRLVCGLAGQLMRSEQTRCDLLFYAVRHRDRLAPLVRRLRASAP